MNRSYRLVWSKRHNALVVASENARGRGKSGSKVKTIAMAVASALLSLGGGEVLAGDVEIANNRNTQQNVGSLTGGTGTPPSPSEGTLTITPTGSVIFGGSVSAGNVLLNSSVTGSIINQGTIGGVPSSIVATVGLRVNAGRLSGGLSNSGTIVGANAAIAVLGASSIGGDIVNTNHMEITGSLGGSSAALDVRGGSTVAGVIWSSGTIADDFGNFAILVDSSTVLGGLTNTGTLEGSLQVQSDSRIGTSSANVNILNAGSISSSLEISGDSTVHGSIINQKVTGGGTINRSLEVRSSLITGGITNSGTINSDAVVRSGAVVEQGFLNSGTINGLAIRNGALISQGFTNHGVINSSVDAFLMDSSTINGGLTNTGTIEGAASGSAMLLRGGSLINGVLTNSGTISSGPSGAIEFAGGTITGGLINSGVIQGSGHGISIRNDGLVADISNIVTNIGGVTSIGTIAGRVGIKVSVAVMSGDITNAGVIRADSGQGVLLNSDSTLTGALVNQAGGLITAPSSGTNVAAVYLSSGSSMGSVTNSGTIEASTGIWLQNSQVSGVLENRTGGTISGLSGLGAGVRLTGSTIGSLTNSGSIEGNHAVRLAGSEVSADLVNQSDGLISSINTSSGAGVYLSGNSTIGSVINAGTILGHTALNFDASTITGNIDNSGLLSGLAWGVKATANSLVNGDITNALTGTISGGGTGVLIDTASSISGALVNAGLIRGQAGLGVGVRLELAATIGGLTNSGTIEGGLGGVLLSRSRIDGALVNQAGGLVSGFDAGTGGGVYLTRGSSVSSVTNSGTIQGAGSGIALAASAIDTDLLNQAGGLISGQSRGVFLFNSDVGGVSNNGTIQGDAVGALFFSSDIGNITNRGTIEGAVAGIVLAASTITGSLVNQAGGLISGPSASSGAGVFLVSGSTIGSVTNTGTIEGAGGVVIADASTITGALVNQAGGTIVGAVDGVSVNANSRIRSGITNSGLIIGGASGNSLNLRNSTNPITINNSGTLQGNVYLGSAGNVLNLNGNSSRVIGNVSNSAASSTINVNGTFTSEGTFNVGEFNVNDGAVFNWLNSAHTITASTMTVGSGGTLNVGTSTQSLTGNYVQRGILQIGLTDPVTGYGRVQASGTADVAGGVDVNIIGSPTIANGTTVAGVVTAVEGMTVTPSEITVTDNSLFYDFTAATVSNPGFALDLVVRTNPSVFEDIASAYDNPAAQGVAGALDSMLVNGIPAGLQPLFDELSTLTPDEANTAMAQLVPAVQGATSFSTVNTLRSMNKIIQARVESNQGLSSGDNSFERYAWARVFGSWSQQNNQGGMPGFDTRTGGLVIGADAPVNDRVRAGMAFTYARSVIDSKWAIAPSSVNVNTYEIVGYGSYNIDERTDANFQLDVGYNQASSTRQVFGGGSAGADFGSVAVHASAGLGRVFELSSQTNVTPSMRLDYTYMHTGGYTESGATIPGVNLKVDSSNFQELMISADAKMTHQFDAKNKFTANVMAGYDALNSPIITNSQFVGGGPTFATPGLTISPWLFRGGVGFMHNNNKGLEISFRVDVEGRPSGYLNETVSARLRWLF